MALVSFAALCSVKKLTSQAPYQPSAVATLASDMASQRPTPDAQHDGDIGDERLGDCTDSSRIRMGRFWGQVTFVGLSSDCGWSPIR